MSEATMRRALAVFKVATLAVGSGMTTASPAAAPGAPVIDGTRVSPHRYAQQAEPLQRDVPDPPTIRGHRPVELWP